MECNKFNRRKLFKLPFVLLLIVGFSIHLYSCCDEYFGYDIASFIRIREEPHQMPAVAVCPSTYRGDIHKELVKYPLNVRFNMTPGFTEYFESCLLTLPSGDQVNCTEVTKVSEYIGPYGKCFVFFRSSHLTIEPKALLYYKENQFNKHYLSIKIQSPFTVNMVWFMRVNPPNEPLVLHRRDVSKQFIEVNLFSEMNNVLDYIEKHRLPPPFHDGCYIYSKTKYKTKYKAIYDCLNDNYKNKTSGMGHWQLYTMIEYGKEYINESTHYLEESLRQRKYLYPKALDACTKKYQRNACKSTSYNLKILSTRKGPLNNTALTLNFVNLPFKYMYMAYVPRTSVLEFFNILGGVVSLWFNASLFTWSHAIADRLLNQFARMKKQCQTAMNQYDFRMVKIFNITLILLCSIGCFLQSFDIGKIYIEKNLYIWISGVEPEYIYFSKLTFCVDRVFVREKVQQLYPQIYNSVPFENWDDQFTIDQMFNLTLNLEDVFVDRDDYWESAFISTSMRLTPILEEYSFDKELTYKYVCFSTFARHNYKGSKPYKPYLFSQVSSSFLFHVLPSTTQFKLHNRT